VFVADNVLNLIYEGVSVGGPRFVGPWLENFVVKIFWPGFARRDFAICNKFLGAIVSG
jgi:hypothetical protein